MAHLPIGHSRRIKVHVGEKPQGIGGESVPTAFVAGERGLIDQGDIVAK